MKTLCVFCGSSPGFDPAHAAAAAALGTTLAESGIGLVYGGGGVGLMGIVADAVLAGGGTALGVIPQALFDMEVAHRRLTELRVVKSMHERKAMMADHADGFIALSGRHRHLRGIVRGVDLGAARRSCQAGRAPQRRRLLRQARQLSRRCRRGGLLQGRTPRDASGRCRSGTADRKDARLAAARPRQMDHAIGNGESDRSARGKAQRPNRAQSSGQ